MRFRSVFTLASLTAVALAGALVAGDAHGQDFDPRGRRKPPPSQSGRPPATTKPRTPAQPAPPDSDGAGRQIDKYRRIVLSQPGSSFPLQKLIQLYRDKDGQLAALIADFEARAAQEGPEKYAATIALAGIYKADGRTDDAVSTYEKAIAQKGNDPVAILALARLLQDRGDPAARKRYEDALALQTTNADKEQTLRTLMTLALDGKDYAAAKEFHKNIIKIQPTSMFVRGELGRELFQRGEFARAEAEFKELVQAVAGDNRALAPALKDLGKAQARAHENQEALATLKKALSVAGQDAAVRAEIYETITELYRADGQLPVLVADLEKERPNDYPRLALLGALYEEVGDGEKALAAYRRALAIQPRQIDLRLKVIRVLQSQGEIDKAIAEYDALIRAAPNNPQFVFDQCEALMQRGDRARALKLLESLEARGGTDEEVLSRLADFYGRIGEADRALRTLTRLTQLGTNDPGHLADLGDQYFQSGNKALAIQTWKRILTTVTPRARALSAIGDVYLEHDMLPEALSALREASSLEPKNVAFRKQLAGALERGKQFEDARKIWQELAGKAQASSDKLLAREARARIVALWGFEHALEAQIAPLSAKFGAAKPDIEAGRTLAEVHTRLRALAPAETTLRKVLTLAPGDVDSYLALERVLVQQSKFVEAIALLEKLATVEPNRAREVYQRMAQYAMQVYRDDDAVKYAARAVELNPDDAEGHKRLGEMYRQRQDTERAIVEFRAAITKNERLYLVYLELADLLLSQGQNDEADRLFRRVLRGAPDEELVGRAGRLSMQLNLGKGTLESLEQELLPLAIGNPQRKVYRRLLIEIYGNLTFSWMQKSRHGTPAEVSEASAALARIGARAVKPLLDTLADGDPGQQRVAIDVLGYVQNKNAGPALFAFATGQADTALRTRAMLACGALRDPALLPRYESVIFPKTGASGGEIVSSDTISVAATWAVAKLGDKRSAPLLKRILKSGSSNMRAFAALGLGATKDASLAPLLAATARSLDAGSVARAAAAFALGELGKTGEVPTLLTIAQGTDRLPKRFAMLSLAKLGASAGTPAGGDAALSVMTDAIFAAESGAGEEDSSEASRRAATQALVLLATRGAAGATSSVLPVPTDDVDAESTLAQLTQTETTAKDRAAVVVTFAEALERSAKSALATSSEGARAVLEAMAAGPGALEPLVNAEERPETSEARARAIALTRAIEPRIIDVTRHPDPEMRARAIALLARSDSDEAARAIAGGIVDPNELVQRAALGAVGKNANAAAVANVGGVLQKHASWSMRALAAEALGRLGKAGAREAAAALRASAEKESYAIVREAALLALASFDRAAARALATAMATKDPEPRVRETARKVQENP